MSNCCANGDCPKCKEALKRFEGLSAILSKPIPLDKELAGIAYTHPHFSQTIRRAISRIAALEAAIEGLNEFRFCSCGAGSINNEGHEDWCEKTYIVEWKRAALESK
jgi:hypothetical protein